MAFDRKRWALAFGLAAVPAAGAKAEIVIATAGPMTGQYAVFGEQMQIGAEKAVRDLNAAGGVLGQTVVLQVGDDACTDDPEKARAIAEQLVRSNASFVAGHWCSGTSIPASEVYREADVLQISPASTSPLLTERGFDNVFRVCSRDDRQGVFAADYVVEQDLGERIAILHDGTTYGQGLAEEFKKNLNRHGIDELTMTAIEPGKGDYRSDVEPLRARDLDLIYVGGYHTEAALIARDMQTLGMDAQIMSGDALVSDEYWAIAGDAGQGTLMTFPPDPRERPAASTQLAAFEAEGYDPEGYTLYTYAAIQTWAEAVEQAGSTDLDAVIDVLRKATFDTALGPLTFDSKGDPLGQGYTMYQWDDGRYERKAY